MKESRYRGVIGVTYLFYFSNWLSGNCCAYSIKTMGTIHAGLPIKFCTYTSTPREGATRRRTSIILFAILTCEQNEAWCVRQMFIVAKGVQGELYSN